MIDGEEIFESASETGYRLCSAPTTEIDHSIFSASWDKNNPRRYFVCSQNGQLRVCNTDNSHENKYQVVFKRFTSYENSTKEPEKIITSHWDRMVTIPDRPNELIFLLGVSNLLYYTSLPGSDSSVSTNIDSAVSNSINGSTVPYPKDTSAVIASTTRGDIPGYNYGTPIMEICSHKGRVTSLSVSPSGHVLASGDEHGGIRLLLLQLLDDLSVAKKAEQKRRKHLQERHYNTFLPSYNILTNRAHESSVYALEWLPLIASENDVRYYGLVTGSQDRAVRIWSVRCCSKAGLAMIPCQLLDTPSTHVLSLGAYHLVDKTLEIQISRQLAAHKLRQSAEEEQRDFSERDEKHELQAEEHMIDECRSIYVAAGTSIGTIHVWRMSYNNIKAILVSTAERYYELLVAYTAAQPSRDKNEKLNNQQMAYLQSQMPFRIDDGTALHSLLQAHDKPIIHVTVTSNGRLSDLSAIDMLAPMHSTGVDLSTLNCADHLILAASDTGGSVRLYAIDKTAGGVQSATNSPAKSPGSRTKQETSSTFNSFLNKQEQMNLQSHVQIMLDAKKSLRGNFSLENNLEHQRNSLGGMLSGDTAGIGTSSGIVTGGVNNNKPLILVGEITFDAAVMTCAFQANNITLPHTATTGDNQSVMSPFGGAHSGFSSANTSAANSPVNRGGVFSGFSVFSSGTTLTAPPSLLVCAGNGKRKLFSSTSMPVVQYATERSGGGGSVHGGSVPSVMSPMSRSAGGFADDIERINGDFLLNASPSAATDNTADDQSIDSFDVNADKKHRELMQRKHRNEILQQAHNNSSSYSINTGTASNNSPQRSARSSNSVVFAPSLQNKMHSHASTSNNTTATNNNATTNITTTSNSTINSTTTASEAPSEIEPRAAPLRIMSQQLPPPPSHNNNVHNSSNNTNGGSKENNINNNKSTNNSNNNSNNTDKQHINTIVNNTFGPPTPPKHNPEPLPNSAKPLPGPQHQMQQTNQQTDHQQQNRHSNQQSQRTTASAQDTAQQVDLVTNRLKQMNTMNTNTTISSTGRSNGANGEGSSNIVNVAAQSNSIQNNNDSVQGESSRFRSNFTSSTRNVVGNNHTTSTTTTTTTKVVNKSNNTSNVHSKHGGAYSDEDEKPRDLLPTPLHQQQLNNNAAHNNHDNSSGTSGIGSGVGGNGETAVHYEEMGPYYRNNYAKPAVHSSQVIAGQLKQVEDDEVTVSTLATTQSDLKLATRAVTSNVPLNAKRYNNLVKLDGSNAATGSVTGGKRIGKQVDPAWLARKQQGLTDEEVRKALELPHPFVHRTVSFHGPNSQGNDKISAKQAQNNFRYNQEYGLYYEMDKNTLEYKWTFQQNAQDLFGTVDVYKTIKNSEALHDKIREENIRNMIGGGPSFTYF